MESILKSIKKMLGIALEDEVFDGDIIMHINSVLMTLNQLGVGPDEPAFITNEMDTWEKVFGDRKDIEAIKTYIYIKVRIVFDPPTSSFVLEAMKGTANELEWRLNIQAETKKEG